MSAVTSAIRRLIASIWRVKSRESTESRSTSARRLADHPGDSGVDMRRIFASEAAMAPCDWSYRVTCRGDLILRIVVAGSY